MSVPNIRIYRSFYFIYSRLPSDMYKRVTVKVRRGFGENKKLNFIYMLIKLALHVGYSPRG